MNPPTKMPAQPIRKLNGHAMSAHSNPYPSIKDTSTVMMLKDIVSVFTLPIWKPLIISQKNADLINILPCSFNL